MDNFKLEPVDILVNVNRGDDPVSVIKRWALGSPYEHVFAYLGAIDFAPLDKPPLRVPMLFESYGRGVCLRSLSERYGQEVVVMRLLSGYREKIPQVLDEAIELASDSQAYYDYSVIIWHIIPKLIYQKLGISPPLRYQRDERMICSEAILEIFHRAELADILLIDTVPLPGDFVTDSLLLKEVQAGILSEAWVA
ncbi:unnamed protein product [marine sediment metagenome]|uniref:Uncharacterized protein n=1 Tax=marine sediment metagenome TaxID=412755 RepID=X1HIQ4_9ZZZZ